MKLRNISFLFFYSIFCLIQFFAPVQIKAQQLSDSLIYYYTLANYPKDYYDLTEAYSFYSRFKDENLRKNKDSLAIQNLRQIAIIEFKLDLLQESEQTATDALELLDELQLANTFQRNAKIGLYNHLGSVYRELRDYTSALNYYNRVLEDTNDLEKRYAILSNIALTYRGRQEFQKAIPILEEVYEYNFKLGDSIKMARSLNNLAVTQGKLKLPEALTNLERSLDLRLILNHKDGVFDSYFSLSNYYFEREDVEKAKKYAQYALNLADKLNSQKLKLNGLSSLLATYEDSNVTDYRRLSDSVLKATQNIQNRYAAKKYDVGKKEKIIRQKEIEAQKYKQQRAIFFLTGLLVLLGAIFIYFLLKSKHKKDKIRQAYLKETEFSKKVHDELANDMSDLMNLVENKIDVDTTNKSLLLDTVEDIYLRTRDISAETGSIDLINFPESIMQLLMQHNRENTKIVVNDISTINWSKVPDYKKVVIYRCLQELLVNMKKHSRAKVVSFAFKNIKNKQVIRYVDDGVGASMKESKLNGLLNVESRIKSIGGSFNFTTSKGNGFKAILDFNS